MLERVLAQARNDFSAHLERLVRYMRVPSISATGQGIDEMCQMLRDDIEALGGWSAVVPGRELPLVYGRWDVGAPCTLLVHTMYDVALAEEPGWVVPPFSATRMEWNHLGECIVGRGAEDTKSQVALVYNAVAAYRAAGVPLPVNIILVQEASELGSGSLPAFVEEHLDELKGADVAWWPFLTGRADRQAVLYLGVKGLMTGKLRCKGGDWGGPVGKDLHSMHANWIANPALRLAQALAAMKSADDRDVLMPGFYGKYPGPTEAEVALVRLLAERFDGQGFLDSLGLRRFKQQSLYDAIYDHCFKSEFNISGLKAGAVVEGGHKAMIGHEAVASVDMRCVGQQPTDVNNAIWRFLKEHFPEVTYEPLNSYAGDRTPIDSWAIQSVLRVYADMGKNPEIWPTMAGAIANELWTRTVGAAWVCGAPGYAAGKHAANEFIVVDSFRESCEFGIRLLWQLAQSPAGDRKGHV